MIKTQLNHLTHNHKFDITDNRELTFSPSNSLSKKLTISTKFNCLTTKNGIILSRNSDTYINLNQLCNSGFKTYTYISEWFNIKNSQNFIEKLSNTVNIPISKLIKKSIDSDNITTYWGHRQIAIQIAKSICIEYEILVTDWIFKIIKNDQLKKLKDKLEKTKHNKSLYFL
jgi:hypothetical protein